LKKLKVLVACEYSGVVSQAFRDLGHEALSCDLIESDIPNNPWHYKGDVLCILDQGWDIMIAHPPCTHLASSGARWWKEKQQEQQEAIDFVLALMQAPVKHIALENPVGILSRVYRKPDQIVQPWMFGHEAQKTTCLWLKNLPKLEPTQIVDKGETITLSSGRRMSKFSYLPDSKNRWKIRSTTFKGIAEAMAMQYSEHVLKQRRRET
jgi:site-specific DNA-cytosine methylase